MHCRYSAYIQILLKYGNIELDTFKGSKSLANLSVVQNIILAFGIPMGPNSVLIYAVASPL